MTTKPRAAEAHDSAPAEAGAAQPSEFPTSGVHRAAKVRRGAGWTLTEQFVREGYCYRLMRRPVEPSDAGPRFTRREEEALALASDGCSNKRIAQILDVSPSTVGVLLFRAATKLNVKSRDDLVAAYKQLVASSAPEDSVEVASDLQRSK
jgi:DNA-binding CsgD family transcriptional regulator